MLRRVSAVSVFSIALVLGFVVWASNTSVAAQVSNTATVFTSADSGPGSFRAAIARANATAAIQRIHFLGAVWIIELQSTVTFTGPQDLTIDGNLATLDGTEAGGPAFRATGGGDLAIRNLTVQHAPAEGISVDVPVGAQGTIHVSLFKVDILNNDGHGLLVDDQDDPATPAVDGDSPASVDVSLANCQFVHNGYSVSDRDGVRVNEGGIGDLSITIWHSSSRDNGADGIEADAGSILGLVFNSSANNNFEEGFDFNENHAGDLRVDMYFVEANGNPEEGIDYEEDDDFAGGGDLVTTMFQVTANGNGATGGDAGLKIREKGAGNLSASLHQIETSDNVIGGISVREDAEGNLDSDISYATSLANGGHGIDFDENRANTSDVGNLTASVSHSTSSNNGGAGVRADQQTPGTGTLSLSNVTLENNAGGATTGSNVTVSGT